MTQTVLQRRLVRIAASMNAKARLIGAPGRILAESLALACSFGLWRCRYCRVLLSVRSVSFDHVVPLSKGGPNLEANIAICCMTCQRNKFDKTESEFREWMELFRICACGVRFRPRWADAQRGLGHFHSRSCSAKYGERAS